MIAPHTPLPTLPHLRRASRTSRNTFPDARLRRLHDALERHVASGHLPGLVALVWHRGREHAEVLGHLDPQRTAPMRRDTLFRLASSTKPVTAAAAMLLLEECRLHLDDPVDTWLPELTDRRVLRTVESPLDETVPAVRPITVRDLLTFRSGYGEALFLAPTCPFQQALSAAGLSLAEWPFAGSADEFMRRIGRLPLVHQPGERWLYHTSGEILGVLISRVTGMSLGAFLAERIFQPLGMRDTGFRVADAKRSRLPACYGTDPSSDATVELQPAGGGYAVTGEFESGAGGLVSTADDLLAFGRMLLPHGGGERLLSRPALELMATDQLTAAQKARSPFFEGFWESRGWGLGLGVVTTRTDVAEVPGRYGWDGAYGTSCYVDAREGLVGVLMTQRRPDRLALPEVTRDFWTGVYQLLD